MPVSLAGPQLVDLRQLSAQDLEPLLHEEIAEFRRELDWDFTRSADLVRTQVAAHNAAGAALIDGGDVAGYGCVSLTGHKALIWDLYVRPAWRCPARFEGKAESLLFRILFDAFVGTDVVTRIESQLMLATKLPGIERLLLRCDLSAAAPQSSSPFRIEDWHNHHLDTAAQVLAAAYSGHIDARLSDEYRTPQTARQHIANIVSFPGSSVFCAPASLLAFDSRSEAMHNGVGLVLASFVASDVGHIAHICVTPEARGAGLGALLLARSLAALRTLGAQRVTLAVTAANQPAIRLYRRFGFETIRKFPAYVWERSA